MIDRAGGIHATEILKTDALPIAPDLLDRPGQAIGDPSQRARVSQRSLLVGLYASQSGEALRASMAGQSHPLR